MGSWADLKSVDVQNWGVSRSVRDIWIAGCGTIAPLMFGRRNASAKVIASDLSESSLRICSKRLKLFGIHNVHLKCEDLFEVSYSEAFDAVDCYGVLHHTVSPQRVLEKIAKSLRPGGVVRFMVYSREARSSIEDLRSQIVQKKLSDLESVEKFLQEKNIKRISDLTTREGTADALLNPIVHHFSDSDLRQLLGGVPMLQKLHIETAGNFVVFAKRV